MLEPDVTLTDYGLALECAILAITLWLGPTRRSELRSAGILFFLSLGFSAVTGGTVHGFYPNPQTLASRCLWQLTLQSIGLAAFSTWRLAAGILASGRAARWLALAAFPQLVLYSTGALLFTQEFWITFTIYVPAALLLLSAFCRAVWRDGQRFLLLGVASSVLSFTSCFLQFTHIGIHPVYFNHNALAHVVQAIALVLLFFAIRYVAGPNFLTTRVARAANPGALQ
jgi:hypothetical protein